MEDRSSGWKPKLVMLVVSSFFVFAVVALGEVYCRLFTRINFLDNSRGLFAYNRFGNTYGNAPNFEGISFGEKFYTDANGFRIDPSDPAVSVNDASAILVMGDSVAFGPALPESQTISGRLRRRVTSSRVYNGAAIGYDTFDERQATLGFVREHPQIKTVILFFCLNDVSDSSAQIIRSQTVQSPIADEEPGSIVRRANAFLRSRSKLYLWLKNSSIDTQLNYFQSDLAIYRNGDQNVFDALRPLSDLARDLNARGITFKVFLTPYEAQLRPGTPPEYLEPQRLVAEFFASQGGDFYDTTRDFRGAADPSRLFLYGDPMHLSADGTELVADAVCRQAELCE